MIPSTKARKRNAAIFRLCYDDFCKRQGLTPLACVKAHLTKNTLDFNGDRIKLEDWGPILFALGLDRSLHFLAIRSRHPAKQALEDVDSEIKARNVTKRPVLLTRYILYMLVDAIRQCLTNSPVLTCLELEGLPLDLEYVSILCQGIADCIALQNISFYRSNIGDEGCKKLCYVIRNLPNILSLDLSACELTEKGATCVADMLKIQGLHRFDETWKQTLRYRKSNAELMPGLRRVTLNHNQLGNQGVLQIVDAIREDRWLRAIDLQNCGIGELGGASVSEMLNVNKTLYIADLRGNRGVREHLIQEIMRKLAKNNANVNHEYQWISLDPQLMKNSSTFTLVSKPSTSTCRSAQPQFYRQPVSNISKSTLQRREVGSVSRCPSISNASNANSVKRKAGIPWRVDARMKQVKNVPNPTPGAPQMIHNRETTCPIERALPPAVGPSGCNGVSKVKPDILLERLAEEISLRKEAELKKEKLNQEVQRLMKELEKEQAEKEGFCYLKVEAFEAIQQTLDKFVDFMKNVKKAQAAGTLAPEFSEDIGHRLEDEERALRSHVLRKSKSARVKSTVSHHKPTKVSKSANMFGPEKVSIPNIERGVGDYLKPKNLAERKKDRSVKTNHKPDFSAKGKLKTKHTVKADSSSHKPRKHRLVPVISSSSLPGVHSDREFTSELEHRILRKANDFLPLTKPVQVSKVQEMFNDLIQEYDNIGKVIVKRKNGLCDIKFQSLETKQTKDLIKKKIRGLNGIQTAPLKASPVTVRRRGHHVDEIGDRVLKEFCSESENDADDSVASRSFSALSQSSSVCYSYSTDDDVY